MVDVTGLGQSTEVEEESDRVQVLENGEDEEPTDAELFIGMLIMLGEQYLEEADPEELANFLAVVSNSQSVFLGADITAYAGADDNDGYSLEFEAEVEFEAEPNEEVIDDLEGCDCGDSDERD